MARQLRIEYPGAMYHITSRGNKRREIFCDDSDYEKFLKIINNGTDFFKVEVMAYCLMPNHFHFLLRTKKGNLSRFMQWVNVSYTRYFNHKYKRAGHLMQGRYKSIIVGSEEYFLVLSRYIHLNPVKIKKNKKKEFKEKEEILKKYKWSSYPLFMDKSKRKSYLKAEEVLGEFGGETGEGRRKYKEYVLDGIRKMEEKSPFEKVRNQIVLGSDKFFEWIKEEFIKTKDVKAHPNLRGIIEGKQVKDIAEAVAKIYNLKAEEILIKKSKYVEARNILTELAYLSNISSKSLTEIGKELGGISGSGVAYAHKRISLKKEKDKEFRRKLESAANSLSIVGM